MVEENRYPADYANRDEDPERATLPARQVEERGRHRSFRTDRGARPPVSFDIDGEVFHCRTAVPGTLLTEYAGYLGDQINIAAPKVLQFFSETMEGAEHERFRTFVDDPDREVDIEVLGLILEFLLEEYAGRPTQPSAPSRGGRRSSQGR